MLKDRLGSEAEIQTETLPDSRLLWTNQVALTLSQCRLTQLLAGSLDLKTQHQAPTSAPDEMDKSGQRRSIVAERIRPDRAGASFVIGQAPQVGRREVDPPLDPAGNGFFLQRALAQRCPTATPYWSNSCPRSICDACQPASAASTFRPAR